MGQSKALYPFRHHTLSEEMATRAKMAGFSPFLIGKKDQKLPHSFPIIREVETEHHPINGVICAMAHSLDDLFLVLACDIPFISVQTLSKFKQCIVPTIAFDNCRHPLIGIYSKQDKPNALSIAHHSQSMRSFTATFATISVSSQELHNCNYPGDL